MMKNNMLKGLFEDKRKFFSKIKFSPFIMQYPSPDTWTKDFFVSDFLDNLLEMDIKNLNLYIHIPFCDYFCAYCSFSKKLVNNDLIDRYLDKLEQEIKFYNQLINFKSIKIDTIFIG
jgi:coproporphyrinogen III oxidase-like Fe-S oxidoreductase